MEIKYIVVFLMSLLQIACAVGDEMLSYKVSVQYAHGQSFEFEIPKLESTNQTIHVSISSNIDGKQSHKQYSVELQPNEIANLESMLSSFVNLNLDEGIVVDDGELWEILLEESSGEKTVISIDSPTIQTKSRGLEELVEFRSLIWDLVVDNK